MKLLSGVVDRVKAISRQADGRIQRIRGRELLRIRADWFARHPLCAICLPKGRITAATELDHIVSLSKGGLDFDQDQERNRQGLCRHCHAQKSAEDRGYEFVPRATIGVDGWPIAESTRAHPLGEGGSKPTRF